MRQKNNVTIEDIHAIQDKIGIQLTEVQRVKVLTEYNRVCTDRGESWEVIIQDLIMDITNL